MSGLFLGMGLRAHRLRGVSWTQDFHSEPTTKRQTEGGPVHWEVSLEGQATEQLDVAAGLGCSRSPLQVPCGQSSLDGSQRHPVPAAAPGGMRGVGPALPRGGPQAELAADGGSRKHRSRSLDYARKMGLWDGRPDGLGVRIVPPPRTGQKGGASSVPLQQCSWAHPGQGHGPVYHDRL